MKRSVILYGAGANSSSDLETVRRLGFNPVCFCDKDTLKHGATLLGLKILSLADAQNTYKDVDYWITVADFNIKCQIIEELSAAGINRESIINYEEYEKRFGCYSLESGIVFGEGDILACCVTENVPSISFENLSDDQLIAHIYGFHNELLYKFNHDNFHDSKCALCPHLTYQYFPKKINVSSINLITGSVCQFKCVYCSNDERISNIKLGNLKRVLDFIEYLMAQNIISLDTIFHIANGEITLSPLKERVYHLLKEYPCVFYTNAEYFSDEIAQILSKGKSKINVSLDAGTSEAFARIKGRDCFDTVKANLIEYAKFGKVELKYIILPGHNTNSTEIEAFMRFAAEIKAKVILSRDSGNTDCFDENIETCMACIKLFLELSENLNICIESLLDGFYTASRYRQEILSTLMGAK